MPMPVFEVVAAQIAAILKTEPGLITRETTADDVDGWDSVRHVNIVMTLEETYDVQFSDSEIVDAANVGELFDYLTAHARE